MTANNIFALCGRCKGPLMSTDIIVTFETGYAHLSPSTCEFMLRKIAAADAEFLRILKIAEPVE